MQQPSIGRIVHYKLTEDDAAKATRRRTDSTSIAERIKAGTWPLGAKAHIGNPVNAGDVVPLIVVKVWPNEYGPGIPGVNGRAILDGSDSLWVTSIKEGNEAGQWSWPPKA